MRFLIDTLTKALIDKFTLCIMHIVSTCYVNIHFITLVQYCYWLWSCWMYCTH